jgi:hypothetical protein
LFVSPSTAGRQRCKVCRRVSHIRVFSRRAPTFELLHLLLLPKPRHPTLHGSANIATPRDLWRDLRILLIYSSSINHFIQSLGLHLDYKFDSCRHHVLQPREYVASEDRLHIKIKYANDVCSPEQQPVWRCHRVVRYQRPRLIPAWPHRTEVNMRFLQARRHHRQGGRLRQRHPPATNPKGNSRGRRPQGMRDDPQPRRSSGLEATGELAVWGVARLCRAVPLHALGHGEDTVRHDDFLPSSADE